MKAILFLLTLILSYDVFANTFKIEAQWFLKDKLISKSEILALDNEEASIEVKDNDGTISYMQVIATNDMSKKIKNGIKLDFEVGAIIHGKKTIYSQPNMLVQSGKSSLIQVHDQHNQNVTIKVTAEKRTTK